MVHAQRTRGVQFCLATAAILAAGCSGSSGGGNARPLLVAFAVDQARSAPARVRFTLGDRESNPTEISFFYEVAGQPAELLSAFLGIGSNPVTLGTSPAGTDYEFEWLFDAEPLLPADGSLVSVSVFATLTGGTQSLQPGVNAVSVGVGNDAPSVAGVQTPAAESSGIVPVSFTLTDSSSDSVSVAVEFDIVGERPDVGWQLARPALSDSTPKQAFEDVESTSEGVLLEFFWDTEVDLGGFEGEVRLRFTPDDGLGQGEASESDALRVDNNERPAVSLDTGALLVNPDRRRGIPVPFEVVDKEGDAVQLVFQWTRPGEPFAQLPANPQAIASILADPVQRAALRVASEMPLAIQGRALELDLSSLRLPELAGSASRLLGQELVGRELEILRLVGSPDPVALGWLENPLDRPVRALPLDRGTCALVLDAGGSGVWRLREIELATGEVRREVAAGTDGEPTALEPEPGGASVLVASIADFGVWSLSRVELASGEITPLFSVSGSVDTGAVRAVAALSRSSSLVSVGSSLVRVDYADLSSPSAVTLLSGLNVPWGLACDPLREGHVYFSENESPPGDPDCVQLGQCGRVWSLDLASLSMTPVLSARNGALAAWLRNPESLTLESSGARLAVVVDSDPLDGAKEIAGIELGACGGNETFFLAQFLPEGLAALAAARGVRTVAVTTGDLGVGGGVEQRRKITAYAPGTQSVRLDEPLLPHLRTSGPWRIRTGSSVVGSPEGSSGTFLWDSSDVAGGGDVLLRALVLDADLGLSDETGIPKTVLDPLEVTPLSLGGSPQTESPFSLAAADLDSDGDLDLVSANVFADTLTVFTQTAAGVFDPDPIVLSDGPSLSGPFAVGTWDVDADGDLDVVSANAFSNNLSVFFQLPGGSFDPLPLRLGNDIVTQAPEAVVAGDLDGDGDLELISANALGDNLSIFFQTSPGVFAQTPLVLGDSTTTDFPCALALGDVDGDGDPDLVSANSQGHTLSVFFQTAPASFDPTPLILGSFQLSASPQSVALADLDDDGDLDLVSANDLGDSLTIFFQTAPGSFDPIPLTLGDSSVTDGPHSVAVGDLDGNGLLDLAAASDLSDNLSVFFQTSPGVFQAEPLVLGDALTTDGAHGVLIGDIDGDGSLDLASANADGNSLALFLHARPGTFDTAPLELSPSASPDDPRDVVSADFDGNGLLDVASANAGSRRLSVFFQTSPGIFDPTPLSLGSSSTTVGPLDIEAADLDSDGDIDLVSANAFVDNLTIFFQTAPGVFDPLPLTLGGTKETGSPAAVEACDLDGDGDVDLVSANSEVDTLTIFFQSSPGVFDPVPLILSGGAAMDFPASVAAGDLDADGDADLVSANARSDTLTVFFQTAPGVFDPDPLVLGGGTRTLFPVSVAICDVDGGGSLDIVSANNLGDNITVFFQMGTPGNFNSEPLRLGIFTPLDSPQAVFPADMDGDGDIDIVSANELSNDLMIFFQKSPGIFDPLPLSIGTGRPFSVIASDLDGDGDADLTSCNSRLDTLSVLWGGR